MPRCGNASNAPNASAKQQSETRGPYVADYERMTNYWKNWPHNDQRVHAILVGAHFPDMNGLELGCFASGPRRYRVCELNPLNCEVEVQGGIAPMCSASFLKGLQPQIAIGFHALL